MYDAPFSIEVCKTASFRAESLFSAPFARSAVSPHLGLFHAKPISPVPPLSHPLTPDFLHQKRPRKAQIFAPCVFLTCPASPCRSWTLLDGPSIHVTMGKRTAPELRHRLGPRLSTGGRESWPKPQEFPRFLLRSPALSQASFLLSRKPSLGPGIRSIPLHRAIDFSHAASYVWTEV